MRILYVNTPLYDFLTATLIEGLKELGHQVLTTESANYGTKIEDREVAAVAESADLIIVGSNVGVRSELIHQVNNPRRVLVDGSDYQSFWICESRPVPFKMTFKRELSRCYLTAEQEHVFPLPFAAEKRYFCYNGEHKDLLISFLATMTGNPWRLSVHQRLLNLKNQLVVSGRTKADPNAPPANRALPSFDPVYYTILRHSQIGINVMGEGYDCGRFWEILAAKAMLLTQKLDIVIPDDFTDGVNCVTFASLDEFDDKLKFYLDRPDLVRTIAERGYQHLLQYHTTAKRAEYFLRVVAAHIHCSGPCC
ncbi:MAG: glycosyltransferase family 1 protein [Magnetococcales bacterium]|nr:glycosyltransferase family 1 protein [Magnetococcales bacterium]